VDGFIYRRNSLDSSNEVTKLVNFAEKINKKEEKMEIIS